MNTSVIYLFARMLLGMGVVIAVMALAARFVQRKRAGAGLLASKNQPPQIKVISRHSLAKGSHLVLVAVGEQTLLLGLHSSGVSLLSRYRPQSGTGAGQVPSAGAGAGAGEGAGAGAGEGAGAGAGAGGGVFPTGRLADENDITVAARQILERGDYEGQGRTPSAPMALGLRRSAWTATLEQLRELTLRRS